MICSVHDKGYSGGNLTKTSDDELVAVGIVMMGDVAFEVDIAEIREVADYDVRVLDGRFYVGDRLATGDGKCLMRIRCACFRGFYLFVFFH